MWAWARRSPKDHPKHKPVYIQLKKTIPLRVRPRAPKNQLTSKKQNKRNHRKFHSINAQLQHKTKKRKRSRPTHIQSGHYELKGRGVGISSVKTSKLRPWDTHPQDQGLLVQRDIPRETTMIARTFMAIHDTDNLRLRTSWVASRQRSNSKLWHDAVWPVFGRRLEGSLTGECWWDCCSFYWVAQRRKVYCNLGRNFLFSWHHLVRWPTNAPQTT